MTLRHRLEGLSAQPAVWKQYPPGSKSPLPQEQKPGSDSDGHFLLPYHMRRDQADKADTTDKCHRNSCDQRPCDHTSNDQRIYRNAKAFRSMMSTFKGIIVPSVPIKPEPRCQRQNTDQTDFSPSGSSKATKGPVNDRCHDHIIAKILDQGGRSCK